LQRNKIREKLMSLLLLMRLSSGAREEKLLAGWRESARVLAFAYLRYEDTKTNSLSRAHTRHEMSKIDLFLQHTIFHLMTSANTPLPPRSLKVFEPLLLFLLSMRPRAEAESGQRK
jgi:hypothetical protein